MNKMFDCLFDRRFFWLLLSLAVEVSIPLYSYEHGF